jgi:hypothetical protein
MLSFLQIRTANNNEAPTTLAAYFQDTVFYVASPERKDQSHFRRVMGTGLKEAENAAIRLIEGGSKLAQQAGSAATPEEGVLYLLDRCRERLGVEVNKNVSYADGDVNRLWPGLHLSS